MANLCFISNKDMYEERLEEIDYGIIKQFVYLKSVRKKGIKVDLKKHNTDEFEKERRSILRIKGKIREYALCNDFQYFYTQTLKENRFDLNNFKSDIMKKFKAYKRINRDFIYLIIYEKHKNGAYHLHGLIGYPGVDLYINKNGYLSLGYFEDLGFNSLKEINNEKIDKLKVSSYITKYISKDICKTDSGYSYFNSKGLKTAKKTIITNPASFSYIFNHTELKFENDYIKIFE